MRAAAPATSDDPAWPHKATFSRLWRAAQFWMKFGHPLKLETPSYAAIRRALASRRPPDTGR